MAFFPKLILPKRHPGYMRGSSRTIIHKTVKRAYARYSSYAGFIKYLKRIEFLDVDKIDHYLMSLRDPVRYRPLTFKTLAKHILTREKSEHSK